MTKPELIQHSCYKFMLLLGFIDLGGVASVGIFMGIQAMLGSHYCENTLLWFVVGAVATGNIYKVYP